MLATKFLQIIHFFSTSNLIEISIFVAHSWISKIKHVYRLLVYGTRTKLVSNWEQNMLYTKVSKFYVEKHIYVNNLEKVIFRISMCILQTRK